MLKSKGRAGIDKSSFLRLMTVFGDMDPAYSFIAEIFQLRSTLLAPDKEVSVHICCHHSTLIDTPIATAYTERH